MERLQAALEKARATRDAVSAQDSASANGTSAVPHSVIPASGPVTGDVWAGLAPLELPAQSTRKSRMTTGGSSSKAAPFDLLRTRVLQQTQTHGWKRIAIVSAGQGAGKTMVTANLAFAISRQAELRTIALDLDMRRPNLAATLEIVPPAGGMHDVLSGEKSFAELGRRVGTNLAFGFNERASRGTAELLQSQRTIEALAGIEATYRPDFMLFDLPPLLGADDSLGFLRNVDAALFVVEAEKTPIKQIDHIERQIAELTNVLGIVLNKCRYEDALYGAGYSYY